MPKKTETLEPDCTYHIYNRANANERLFLQDENYRFFLEKYRHYVHPVTETFCYCLMPNHFHFLVRIKSEKELIKAFAKDLTGFKTCQVFFPSSSAIFSIPTPNLSISNTVAEGIFLSGHISG